MGWSLDMNGLISQPPSELSPFLLMGKLSPREMTHSHNHLNSCLQFPWGRRDNEDGMLQVKHSLEDMPQSQLVQTWLGSRLGLRKKLGESAPLVHFKTIGFI